MKVLMLGWEFPPMFSGGLGIATHGIVKALRSRAQIKLIVPRSDPSSALQNVNIIGLNNFILSQLADEQKRHEWETILAEVEKIPLSLSPYHEINQAFQQSSKELLEATTQNIIQKLQHFFSSGDVYGLDILRKVQLFAELVDQLAHPIDFDVIHAHDWVTYPAGLRVKKRTGKPLVLHVHALETDRAGEEIRNEIYQLEKDALEQADKIFAVSQYTKENITRLYHIDGNKVEVIHNGVEPKRITRKHFALKDKIVVFLGRITNQKGPHFLLETVAKVVRVYPDVKFVVGGTGDQFAYLLETAAYQKLGNKFIFTGFLPKEKVDELLAMADVYFMPSVSEPFGLTALEAAQHEVPVVLSSNSGVKEVLGSALKADFWDTDKYANYIYALLKYNNLHRELSTRAREEAGANTWDMAAQRIYDEYEKLVSVQFLQT